MENKELKDYILLYTPCEVECSIDPLFVYTIVGFSKGCFELKSDHISGILNVPISLIKPYLISLESAFKDGTLSIKKTKNFVPKYSNIALKPEEFRMCLDNFIDIFGLIDAGLAIDKNKPPQQ